MLNGTDTPTLSINGHQDYTHAPDCCPNCGYHAVTLSGQEAKTFSLLLHGRSMEQIGEMLFLSPKTIATYKYRIHEKLGIGAEGSGTANTSIELYRYWLRERAVVMRQLLAGENVGAEFAAGYIKALEDSLRPDIRMITGKVGTLSERDELPPPPRRC